MAHNDSKIISFSKIILYIICFFILSIVIVRLINLFFPDLDDTGKENFVVLISAFLGGLLAFVGVIYTIRADKERDKKERNERDTPEIFLPFKYDIIESIYVHAELEGEQNVANKKVYLKNTDKAPFIIKSIDVFKSDKKSSLYSIKDLSFVEKGQLFCLGFYFSDELTRIDLNIETMNKIKQRYIIILKNDYPLSVEREQKNESNES